MRRQKRIGLLVGMATATTAVIMGGGSGSADAAPQVSCAGSICTNHGDQPGVGFGNYRCPNGVVYPSFAVVLPHSSAFVFPANCAGPNSLY